MSKARVLAASAAIVMGGIGAAVGTASAGSPSLMEGPWLVSTTMGPAVKAGTSCTTQGAIGHTAWGTGVMCNTYITNAGAKAKHWSYLKFWGDDYYDWCTTDGYAFDDMGDMPHWEGDYCFDATEGRIPLSTATTYD